MLTQAVASKVASKVSTVFIALGLAALTPACAGMQPPVHNSGPVTAPGLEVAVLRQSCSQTVEPDLPGNDLVEAHIEVAVRNTTPGTVTVHRDQLRLRAPDGSAIRPSTWFSAEPLAVEAGQARTFAVRFMSRGGLSCAQEMRLDAGAALTEGAAPLKIGSIAFQPHLL
jgi:hypothetical protein